MNHLRFITALFISSGLCCGALGDTVTLKNGEVIEGKISSESDDQMTIEINLSGGITDSRTVPKSDVVSIAKIQPDELAWADLKNLKLGQTSLSAASYEAATQSLHAFLKQFAASPFAEDARNALAALEQEKARVDSGEIKINGQWLTKEEAHRERYQIAAAVSFQFMRDQTSRGDFSGALNTFDGIEKQYPGSRIYPDAVDLARRALVAFQPDLISRLQSLRAAEAERNKAIESSSPAQKAEIKSAIEKEHAAESLMFSEAQRHHLNWPPFIARSEKSLTAIAAKIPSESQRLAAIDVAKIRQSLKAADESKLALLRNDFATALGAAKEAQSLWPENDLVARLQEEIKASQAEAIAAAAEAEAEQKKIAAEEQKRVAAEEREKAAQAAREAAAAAQVSMAAPSPNPGVAAPPKEKPFLLTATGASSIVASICLLVAGIGAYRKLKGLSPESID